MFCPKCGVEVGDSQGFCKHCGARLASSTALSQPKRKMSRFSRLLLWSFGILFGLIVLHAVSSDSDQSTQSNLPPSAPPTAQHTAASALPSKEQEPQKPPFSVVDGDTTYHGARSSNVGVAVLRVTSGPFLFGGLDGIVKADGKFIFVAVAIFNGQNSAVTMDTGLFEILDTKGNVYSASVTSMDVGSASNLFLAQINPGITKTGEIVFDVPQTLSVDNLLLRFRGGMTGNSAVLPLKVDSTIMPVPAPPDSTTRPSNSVPGVSY